MNKVMLLYPPGRLLQRSEDRAQCNIGESAAGSVHACNDLGYCAAFGGRGKENQFLNGFPCRTDRDRWLRK